MLEDSAVNEVVETKSAQTPARPASGVKKVFLGVLVLILFLFPLLSFVGATNNYVLHMLLFIFMYIAMASSWNIIGGYAGGRSVGAGLWVFDWTHQPASSWPSLYHLDRSDAAGGQDSP
jgi:branched-chain amino acid transport system permease protein